jgi:hypothetical protein
MRAVLSVAVVVLTHTAFTWHAFLGQESIPTISGTNLVSSLELPTLTPSIDECSMTLTSLNKVIQGRHCLLGQEICTLECATAWGSLLRDYEAIIELKPHKQKCMDVKRAIEASLSDILDTGFSGGVYNPEFIYRERERMLTLLLDVSLLLGRSLYMIPHDYIHIHRWVVQSRVSSRVRTLGGHVWGRSVLVP